MLTIISPAKRLDFSADTPAIEFTKPELLTQSKKLVERLRKLSPRQVAKLMGVNDKIAADVHRYFRDWKPRYNAAGSKPSLLAFRGDVYLALAAEEFSAGDFEFAGEHLRILSGLYGVLRPQDLIQPYRLEMGTPLKGEYGSDLYAFWGDRIATSLAKALQSQGDDVVVNLASKEYFGAARTQTFACRVITPVFKDFNRGQYRVLSFLAKRARGMMVSYLIRRRVDDLAGLLKFREGGYRLNREQSTDDRPVFTRDNASG